MKFTVFKDGSWVDSTSSYEEENNPDYLCTIEANDKDLEAELALSKEAHSITKGLHGSAIKKLAEASQTILNLQSSVDASHSGHHDAAIKLKVAVRIIRELQAMDTICHLDDHFEFLETVKDIK